MKPTVGRIVHFFDIALPEPQAAIITHVWNDSIVNLAVFVDSASGGPLPRHSVGHRKNCSNAETWDWPERTDYP